MERKPTREEVAAAAGKRIPDVIDPGLAVQSALEVRAKADAFCRDGLEKAAAIQVVEVFLFVAHGVEIK